MTAAESSSDDLPPRSPRSPRRVIARGVQAVLRRAGYELQPYVTPEEVARIEDERAREAELAPAPADLRLAKLLNGHEIGILLDVGANAGQYAGMIRRAGYERRIVSFEPITGPFSELRAAAEADPNWDCRQLALGSSDGPAEINIARNSYSSSILGMMERHGRSAPESEYMATEEIIVSRLDSLWEELVGPADRPFLKLDVQGYEMEVLRGAEYALPKLLGVQAELSLVPLYEGAPDYKEVVAHLEGSGFRLAGLDPEFTDPETGELLQMNGTFVRD